MVTARQRRKWNAEWHSYDKDMEILDELISGKTAVQVAATLDLRVSEVHRVVKKLRAMKSTTVEEWREIEDERLMSVWRILWPRIAEGDLQAIDRGLKVIEMKAKMHGLNVEKGATVERQVIVLPETIRPEDLARLAEMPLLEEGQSQSVSGGDNEADHYTEGEVTVIDEGE